MILQLRVSSNQFISISFISTLFAALHRLSVPNVVFFSIVFRFLVQTCISLYGIDSIKNPNVLEYSLNKAYWDENAYVTEHLPSLSSCINDKRNVDVATSDIANSIRASHVQSQMSKRLTISQKYSKSGCLCTPCLKVVTVNIVQSTYTVPTYMTPGGDLRSLNSLCKHSSRFLFLPLMHLIDFYFITNLFIYRLLSMSLPISSPPLVSHLSSL